MSRGYNGPREERDCGRCGQRRTHVARMGSRTAEWACTNCGATAIEFVTADEIRARRPAPEPKPRPARQPATPKRRRQTTEERRAFAQAAAMDRAFRRATGAS